MQAHAFANPSARIPRARGVGRSARTSTSRVACKSTANGQQPHIVVVGAGAAGLTAAYFAAQAGAKVTLLERTKESGKKILMSGGSRCNVLPMHVDLQRDFFTEGSRTSLKAIFASWSLNRCRDWLEQEVGLELGEEAETSKVFPLSNSSKEVRDKLLEACVRQGVDVRFNASLEGLRAIHVNQIPSASGSNASHSVSELQSVSGSGSSSGGDTLKEGDSRSGSDLSEVTSSGGNIDGSNYGSSDESSEHDGRNSRSSSSNSSNSSGSSNGVVAGDGESSSSGSTSSSSSSSSSSSNGGGGGGGEHSSRGPGQLRWQCWLGGSGGQLEAEKLILCTGGLSFPAVGTDGTGHRLLQHLGHDLIQPYPALTPLQGMHPANHQLAGLSMYDVEMWAQPASQAQEAAAAAKKKALKSQRNALLFTHKGFSGPSVLDLSHVPIMAMLRNEAPPVIRVSWTRETAAAWEERLKAGGTALVSNVLQRAGIRERLADALCVELQLQDRKMSELKKSERAALVSMLTAYELKWTGHEGYKKAEIDTTTMESKTLPGIFLAGEICDVFGRIGGFNFYWAWVSGRLAGLGAAKSSSLEQPKKARKGKRGAAAG